MSQRHHTSHGLSAGAQAFHTDHRIDSPSLCDRPKGGGGGGGVLAGESGPLVCWCPPRCCAPPGAPPPCGVVCPPAVGACCPPCGGFWCVCPPVVGVCCLPPTAVGSGVVPPCGGRLLPPPCDGFWRSGPVCRCPPAVLWLRRTSWTSLRLFEMMADVRLNSALPSQNTMR